VRRPPRGADRVELLCLDQLSLELGAFTLEAFLAAATRDLPQFAVNDRAEAREVAFEHDVSRSPAFSASTAASSPIVPDMITNGDIAVGSHGSPPVRRPAEARQAVVTENHLPAPGRERAAQALLAVDALGHGVQAVPLQLVQQQLGVRLGILDHQQPQRAGHRRDPSPATVASAGGRPTRVDVLRMARGGPRVAGTAAVAGVKPTACQGARGLRW